MFTIIKRIFTGRESEPPPPERYRRVMRVAKTDGPEELDTADAADETVAFPTQRAPQKPQMQKAGDDREILDGDLWGTTFVIEYTDSKGEDSIRRVAMRHFVLRPGKSLVMSANCFERNALRHFRYDRIQSVIDDDGIIYEPNEFFRNELHCPIDDYLSRCLPESMARKPAVANKKTNPTTKLIDKKPGIAHRSICRDGLRILVAIARSDGDYCDTELAEIVSYIESEAKLAGIETTNEDRDALRNYLRRQRPDAKILEKCLKKMDEAALGVQERFLKAARKVILADGVVHKEETKIIDLVVEKLQN